MTWLHAAGVLDLYMLALGPDRVMRLALDTPSRRAAAAPRRVGGPPHSGPFVSSYKRWLRAR